MRLEKGEYSINGDNITINRKVLEEWAKEYKYRAESYNQDVKWFNVGKEEILLDLLKHFEQDKQKTPLYDADKVLEAFCWGCTDRLKHEGRSCVFNHDYSKCSYAHICAFSSGDQ